MSTLRRIAATVTGSPKARSELIGQRDALAAERDSLKQHLQRVEREAGEARSHVAALAAERDDTARQRDALARQRDELAGHLARIEAEIAEALHRVEALAAERDELLAHGTRLQAELLTAERQREVLATERDELLAHARDLQVKLDAAGRLLSHCGGFPPGSYYSPIVDPADSLVRRAFDDSDRADPLASMPAWSSSRVAEWFARWSARPELGELPECPTPGFRYHLDNPYFSHGDGLAYAGLLLELRPRRVIEIGTGFSSCLALDVSDRWLDRRIRFRGIDPHPEPLLDRLAPSDPYRDSIAPIPLQDAADAWFDELEPGDFCFYDGSHVAKTGSDVNDFYFRILPRLTPGVVVHIHDVFYPFEYPAHWILSDRRSWNELYLLRAWLEGNRDYEILTFNDQFFRANRAWVSERLPVALKNTGSSLWLRKIRCPSTGIRAEEGEKAKWPA